jgi:ribonuclease D
MNLVDSRSALDAACRALAGAPSLYLDTEFESSQRGTQLCLIQISRGTDAVWLIDALRLTALEPLAGAIGDPSQQWILHAGQQDLPLLLSRLPLDRPPRLFDTQIAWALLGVEHSVSLAYLQYRLLGLRTGKPHQADDWVRRPLPASQLEYAAGDVAHLPALHRELERRATALDRLPLVEQASLDVLLPPAEAKVLLTLESFRNAWQLDRHGQAAMRFLIDWYNGLDARARDLAPEPKTLLSIASRLPQTREDLGRIKGVRRSFAEQQGEQLAGALMRATAAADAADFQSIEPPPYSTPAEVQIDGWLAAARAELCVTLDVAPELAFPGRVMRRLRDALLAGTPAHELPSIIEGWRSTLLRAPLAAYAAQNPLPATPTSA